MKHKFSFTLHLSNFSHLSLAAQVAHVQITDAQDLIPHDPDLDQSQLVVNEAHQSQNWSQH